MQGRKYAGVAELADAPDLGSNATKVMRVWWNWQTR